MATLGLPVAAALSYLLWSPWVAGVLLLPWLLLVWIDKSLRRR
jgi:hypothetical protein